jgi:hypothetical protein
VWFVSRLVRSGGARSRRVENGDRVRRPDRKTGARIAWDAGMAPRITRTRSANGFLCAVVVVGLGTAGCSSSRSLGAGARLSPPAAAQLEPPVYDEAVRVGPEYTQALVSFHRSVKDADRLGATEQNMAIRRSLRLLADAVQNLPYARSDRLAQLGARAIRDDEARAALGTRVGSPGANDRAIVDALVVASEVLGDAARGPYRGAPEVGTHAEALREAVVRLRAGESLRVDRALAVHALAEADRTLTAVYAAVASGKVP